MQESAQMNPSGRALILPLASAVAIAWLVVSFAQIGRELLTLITYDWVCVLVSPFVLFAGALLLRSRPRLGYIIRKFMDCPQRRLERSIRVSLPALLPTQDYHRRAVDDDVDLGHDAIASSQLETSKPSRQPANLARRCALFDIRWLLVRSVCLPLSRTYDR